ncbi:unnamed protein product [Brachionus calyciflorus]|uniref:G-protein coupled receptors family 2 profile 2 domain-containing protein n=1 Tax=Brachionus calyciflorus TaxID=104777 RepID=A0A813V0T8_9BILA|nr:unnamed protein product [Brachionus calyciflorus]
MLFLFYYIAIFLIYHINSECNGICTRNEVQQIIELNRLCKDCIFNSCCTEKNLNQTLQPNYQCNARLSENEAILTIGSCPEWYKDNYTINRCHSENDLISKTPVFSNQTNHFYKNIFCAKCNSKLIELSKIIFFKAFVTVDLYFELEQSEIFNFLNKSNQLIIDFEIPRGIKKPNYCFSLIDSCPLNFPNQQIINSCHNLTDFHFKSPYILKNEFCAQCNQIEYEANPTFTFYTHSTNSLQLLFDLSELRGEFVLMINASMQKESLGLNQSIKLEDQATPAIDLFKCNKQNSNQNLSSDLIKKYLTLIGHLISIISLIILLISYFRNKGLRNLPGKILINLSISLLFSQVFFLVSSYYVDSLYDIILDGLDDDNCDLKTPKNHFENLKILFIHIRLILPCFLTGIFTHYFYLAFFIWSNIMAFDLFKMFTESIISVKFNKNSSNIFIKYSLTAWLLPILIILILMLKNYRNLSYGFKNCFISSNIDLLIFFIAPILIILSLNFMFLIVSIRSVKAVDNLKKRYIGQQIQSISLSTSGQQNETNATRTRLFLFIKLFVLTGMTWILGLISAFLNNKSSFLWYIYVFFNSLQGLFILCSYAFNQNINYKVNFFKSFSNLVVKKTVSIQSSNVY